MHAVSKAKNWSDFKNFLPIKFVIKLINLVYDERLALLKSKCIMNLREFDILTFFYTIMLNIYEDLEFTNQNTLIFLYSLKKY